jgi:hypothetical protein
MRVALVQEQRQPRTHCKLELQTERRFLALAR